MDGFVSTVERVNGAVNGFVWGLPMLILLVGTGILMTILTKVFQVSLPTLEKKIPRYLSSRACVLHLQPPSEQVISPALQLQYCPEVPEQFSGCG